MTSCNQASAKLFWKQQQHDFRAVVLRIKGVVGQKPCYFPAVVFLKQDLHLPKRLGVGRAWMRTHSRPYTATKVAVARGNMIYGNSFPKRSNKSISVRCWNIWNMRPSECFKEASHLPIPGFHLSYLSWLRFPLHCMNRPGLQLECLKHSGGINP